MWGRFVALGVVSAACGRIGFEPIPARGEDGGGRDGSAEPGSGGSGSGSAGSASTTLTGLIHAKSGPNSGRLWLIQITNAGSDVAVSAEVSAFTLTQTTGTPCTTTVTWVPATAGDIAPNDMKDAPVRIDFSACDLNDAFSADVSLSANGGANVGAFTRNNERE